MSKDAERVEYQAVLADLSELDELATEPLELYLMVLDQIADFPEVVGAIVWLVEGSQLQALCQAGGGLHCLSADGEVRRKHRQFLLSLRENDLPRAVMPSERAQTRGEPNPTQYVVIAARVVAERPVAIVECFLDCDASPHARHAVLGVVEAVSGLASRFHQADTGRNDASWWRSLHEFSLSAHESLHEGRLAYTIANEGRSLIACDRLTVLIRCGAKYCVAAVSGAASVNRRATGVRLLEELCTKALAFDDRLSYPTKQLPPQLERVLETYLDHTPAVQLTVQALATTSVSGRDPAKIGALVVEQFSGGGYRDDDVRTIALHAGRALDNAQQHRLLGRLWRATRLDVLPKVLLLAVALLAVFAVLILIPTDFTLEAEGTLQPDERRFVFAPRDGVVDDLLVRHGDRINDDQPVAIMRSSSLDLQLEEVAGQLQSTTKKLAAVNAARTASSASSVDRVQTNQLAAEEEELRAWLNSLERQQQVLFEQKNRLTITSPIDGEIITWEVEDLLTSRPVGRGQILMTIAQLDGPWVAELHLPERRVGHFREAQRDLEDSLEVSYILATDPARELAGRVTRVAKATTTDADGMPGLLVTVSIDDFEIAQRRPGARVSAKVHCGRRSLGYVWLHELFEFLQSHVFFRIP